jgi:hypothetical protein
MSNVVFFDPNGIVQNLVTNYLISVNTPDYESMQNVLINPDLSSVHNVLQKYWKVQDTSVIEMSNSEKEIIDAFLIAKTIRQKKFKVSKYDSLFRKISETWYDTDNGDGTYSGKSEEITYTYESSSCLLLNYILTTFYYDGSEKSSLQYDYFTNSTQHEIIEKH